MLKTLIKKQLLEIWQGYFIDRKSGKARTKKGTAVFFVLFAFLFVGLGFTFYGVACSLGSVMLKIGFNWLYFAIMGLLAMALGVFGSVFNTYASVYLPKDNELLLSLPIPAKTLLLARLSGVYLTSLLYSAWVWIPSLIAYWVMAPLSVSKVIFPVLLIFVIAMFVTFLSCILGWVVALIATKAKGRSFITLFLSLAIFVIYYFVYFKIVNSFSKIMSHIAEIGDTVKSWLHYSYLLGNAADGNIKSMLSVVAVTALLSAICFVVLTRTFTKLSTANGGGAKKTKSPADYTRKPLKKALLNREYKRFTSIATWMLNGGFGLLVLPVGAIAVIIKGGELREVFLEISAKMPSIYGLLPAFLAVVTCFVVSASPILPVSVSIEGKTLWQIQSLPVSPREVLEAKENMAVQLNIYPAFFFVLVCGIVLGFEAWEIVLICVAVWLYIWLFSDFGLFLNLKMPNFNWSNAASLTKQSMPVMISLFGGWAFCVVLGIGGFLLSKIVAAPLVLCAYIVLFLLLWLLLHSWLKNKGAKIFASL